MLGVVYTYAELVLWIIGRRRVACYVLLVLCDMDIAPAAGESLRRDGEIVVDCVVGGGARGWVSEAASLVFDVGFL